MIQDTLQRLKNRLQQAATLDEETRSQILGLVQQLEAETGALAADAPGAERVQSALGLADAAAQVTTRSEPNSGLAAKAISALDDAVLDLEAAHPDAARLVGQISYALSRMGI